jgi:adenylate cyclase
MATGAQDTQFGPFRLDGRIRSLTRDGNAVSIGGRAFDILSVLAGAAGKTVGKAALLDRVWPGVVVEANNLQVHISALRKVLGEGWIITVPGRGYQLAIPVADPSSSERARRARGEAPALTDRPSVAVLPFGNPSGDPDEEYFCEGLADDIITALARSRSLLVIARNSSFVYKGRSIEVKQIASELGVRYVLEGSVRRAAGRIRVNVQLIDAETATHIWAERYDRDHADIFAVQDEITGALTSAINPAVAEAELRRALLKSPGNLGAWEAYQRGLWHARRATADDNRQALEFFRRAAELDPTFASPHAMLAYCYGWGFASGDLVPVQDISKVTEQAARRAIELDPDDTTALSALSWLEVCSGHPTNGLERAQRAIGVAPNDPVAWVAKARVLQFSGRPREALVAYQAALRLSPIGPSTWILLTGAIICHYLAEDYHATVDAAQRAIQDHPSVPRSYRWLAAAYGQLGQYDAAQGALRKAIELSPESFDFYVRSRPPWFRPEDHEHMLAGLRMAGWQG